MAAHHLLVVALRRSAHIPVALGVSLLACSGGTSSPGGAGSMNAGNAGGGGIPATSASGGSAGSPVDPPGGTSATGGLSSGGAAMASGGATSSSTGGTATGGATSSAGTSGAATSGAANGGASSAGTANGGANVAGNAGRSGASSTGGQGGALAGTPIEKVLAGLPVARQEHAVVAAAGEIYVIGGYTPQVTDSVQAYDPAKDSWRDVRAFPERMNHGNAGVVGDQIHVAGYYVNGTMSKATTLHYSYDPKGDAWTPKSPLPMGTQRAAGCVATDASFMYVVGGASDGKSVAYSARYDAAKDAWEELPPLPERREHCSAGVIGGIVYVAGGRMDGITGIEPKTWAYDPSSKMWSEKASLDPPRGGLAGAVLAGRLYVFGGEGNKERASGVFPDVDAYDPTTNTWETLAPLFAPRHGYGAATLDGRIYLAGGATMQGAGASQQNSVFYFP